MNTADQKKKQIPERMCAICRNRFPKAALMRIVFDESGVAMVDPSGRKPGRGVYLCSSPQCLEKAAKVRIHSGAIKGAVLDAVLLAEIKRLQQQSS